MEKPTRALLVDDDEIFCNYFDLISKSYNLGLTVCKNYSEAKQLIEDNIYDLYIFDINLPDGSGFDLAEYVRNIRNPKATIAVISGSFRETKHFKNLKEKLQIDYVFDKPLQTKEVQDFFFDLFHKVVPQDKNLEKKLDKLSIEYNKTIPEKLEQLENLFLQIKEDTSVENVEAFQKAVHKIGGSAGTYGYFKVTLLCKECENFLSFYLKWNEDPQSNAEKLINYLEIFNGRVKFYYQITGGDHSEIWGEEVVEFNNGNRLSLYIVDSDHLFLDLLTKEQAELNLTVLTESDPEKAQKTLKRKDFNPRVVIVSKSFRGSTLTGYDLMDTYLKEKEHLDTQFGFLLEEESLDSRMEVMNKGIKYCFKKPISPTQLLNEAKSFIDIQAHPGCKILVVDDDEDILQFIESSLNELGMEVMTLSEGSSLYETLDTFKPQILLLDIYLPGYNGVDLLKTLRSDVNYKNLLIVVETVSDDIKLISDAYASNVDDILFKPLDKKILQSRISTLANKYTSQASSQEREELTGFFNSKALHSFIYNQFLQNKALLKESFLTLMEIDDFENLKMQFGEEFANKIILNFSELMTKDMDDLGFCFYAGRGKFVFISKFIDLHALEERIHEFLTDAYQSLGRLQDNGIKFNFSCGILSLINRFGTSVEMIIKQAESLVAEAKELEEKEPIKIAVKDVPDTSQTREIILVDQDENLLKILRTAFESHGLKVFTYTSGKEVIDDLMMLEHLYSPLIISERLLSDMDGLEIARTIKTLPFETPIIFMSTLSSEKDIFEGLKVGALDYIVKPFSIDVLLQKSMNALMKTT